MPDAAVRRPQEILTVANAILGQGQLSLAKYLLIVAHEDDPTLDIHDIPRSSRHVLRRVDWRTDLHFQTRTTIDTLDYSGHGLNQGSKVVIAAAGPVTANAARRAARGLPLPRPFRDPRVVLPGILAVQGPRLPGRASDVASFCRSFDADDPIRGFPLIVIVDDSEFTARNERNFLWVTFTRSNPAADIEGIGASSTRSTGAAPALWSSTPGSSRITHRPWLMTRRSNEKSTLWPRPAVRCTVSTDEPTSLAPTDRTDLKRCFMLYEMVAWRVGPRRNGVVA